MIQLLKLERRWFVRVVLLLVASIFVGHGEAAPKKENKALSIFMRKKLAASSMVLEGLAMEDFSLIDEGARKLHQMSETEKWRVRNDPLYREFSEDFQHVTEKLSKAARDEKLDTAALRWMDATMTCIECHQYVRNVLITDK